MDTGRTPMLLSMADSSNMTLVPEDGVFGRDNSACTGDYRGGMRRQCCCMLNCVRSEFVCQASVRDASDFLE
jgi:hypothetical protein